MPNAPSTMDNPEKPATLGTQDEDKQNTLCVGHHYTQPRINNVNKTCILLQITRGKYEPKIVFNAETEADFTTRDSER